MKRLLATLTVFFVCKLSFAQAPLNALQFDGIDDQVTANLPALFNNISTNDFTIEAWVKPQSSAFSRIVFAQSSSTNFATMSTGSGNVIYFYVVSNGTNYSMATSNTLPLNTWTHVAVTWLADSNQVKIYFNGVLQAGISGGSSTTGTLNNLSIGTRPGGAQYFNGTLDEIRIWNVARSACEILVNYQSQLEGTEPNLIAYYNFNAGVANGSNNTGVTNLAESVSGNNGTLSNFALTGNTSNWTTSGASLITLGESEAILYSFQDEICQGETYDFNGQMLTVSGIYTDTLLTAGGCDSIVAFNLTILPVSTSTTIVSECESYTWTNNLTYTSSGVYTDTLTTMYGCDSIAQLNLTILPVSAFTTIVSECESYTWTNNTTYTNSGIYVDTLTNMNGCDSIATLDLTIFNHYETIETAVSCGPYTWPLNGQIYNFPGHFRDTLTAVTGCDSVIRLILTIYSLPIPTVIDNGDGTLSTNFMGISEWLDCSTNTVVATGSSFAPTSNGSYALIVTNFDFAMCSDTSDCILIDNLQIESLNPLKPSFYPNPVANAITISFQGDVGELTITDASGKAVWNGKVVSNQQISMQQFEKGIYLFDFKNSHGNSVQRVVKQ